MGTLWSGAVLLDKEAGVSSFSALGELKRNFDTRKVGHTGTLDPMATGLMVALVGSATRCARFFSDLDKTYEAEVSFGCETDSDDLTGVPTRQADPPDINDAANLVQTFAGSIEQIPPAVSAIHVNGKRSYRRVRDGEQVNLAPRRIVVHEIIATVVDETRLKISVHCSSGTYIRSIARDLGRKIGSAAHLSKLRRTAVGPFLVEETTDRSGNIPIGEALCRLPDFNHWPVDADDAAILSNGGDVGRLTHPPSAKESKGNSTRYVATRADQPVAVLGISGSRLVYELVFPESQSGVS